MLVAISGSQGSGKSSIIKGLKDGGFHIIARKTSRSILSDWDMSLNEINNNKVLAQQFQEEILLRKFNDDFSNINSDEIYITERTPIDLAIYTIMTFGNDNDYSEWMTKYIDKCILVARKYDHVFYLPAGIFNIENDGVRGINKYYSDVVDGSMWKLYHQHITSSKLTQIWSPSLSTRISNITKVLSPIV